MGCVPYHAPRDRLKLVSERSFIDSLSIGLTSRRRRRCCVYSIDSIAFSLAGMSVSGFESYGYMHASNGGGLDRTAHAPRGCAVLTSFAFYLGQQIGLVDNGQTTYLDLHARRQAGRLLLLPPLPLLLFTCVPAG